MKRHLLIVGGSLVVLALVLGVAARLPSVQRLLLLRAVADVPGLELDVERVSVGLGEAEVRGVVARFGGAVFRLPQLRTRHDGWTLLTRRELVVREFVANDLELEVGEGPDDGATEPGATAQAFGGFLAPLRLPLPVTIESVQVGGRVRVSEQRAGSFSAQGRLVVPGQKVVTNLKFAWTDVSVGAAVGALGWTGQLAVTAAADGAVDRLEVDGLLTGSAGGRDGLAQGLVTHIEISNTTATGTERAELWVRRPGAAPTDSPLVRATMDHRAQSGQVSGTWDVQLRRAQLDGVCDLARVPEFSVAAQGAFGMVVASGEYSATGRASVSVAELQRLRRELAGLGALTGTLDFALAHQGGQLRLTKLAASVNDVHGPVLALETLQPVGYRLDTQTADYAQAGEDLMRLEVSNLPLVWAQPWLADVALGGMVDSGEVRLKGTDGNWAVATLRPFVFSGVRLARGQSVLVDRVGGQLALRGMLAGGAWSVDALDLRLRSDAPASPFGAIAAKLEARQDAAGRGRMALPLTLDNGGRRSQLQVAGEWTLVAGKVAAASARIGGETVFLRDLLGLAALVPSDSGATVPVATTGAEKTTAAPGADTKDTQAFWAGLDGRIEVDLKRLVLEAEELTGVQAIFVCDAQRLSLEKFAARTKNAPLEAAFGVTFEAAKAVPYALSGSGKVPGFDVGAWLRAANPAEEPAIETVLEVTAKLEGAGVNLDDLLAGVRGEFVLQGGPGVLRIKDKRVEAASALGGLVLGLLSKDKQQKPAVAAGSQLLEEMHEFRFERIDASLLRGADLNLQFRTIDVRSAEKRLSGTGVARHAAGKTPDDYPLALEMRLAGKGSFGVLLDRANLLDGSKDDLGYMRLREPFSVGGTLGRPDWKRMLVTLGAGLAFGK